MKRIIQSCIIVYCILPLFLTPPLTFAKNDSHNQLRIISDGYDYYLCSKSITAKKLSRHLRKLGLSTSGIESVLNLAQTNANNLSGYTIPKRKHLRTIMYSSDSQDYRACSRTLSEQKLLRISKKRGFKDTTVEKAMDQAMQNTMVLQIIMKP